MYMSIKKSGNPNWGGARLESKLIKYYADQWCRDNGYPLQQRDYKTVSRRPSSAVLRSTVRQR
jgi:hypothetical protein